MVPGPHTHKIKKKKPVFVLRLLKGDICMIPYSENSVRSVRNFCHKAVRVREGMACHYLNFFFFCHRVSL